MIGEDTRSTAHTGEGNRRREEIANSKRGKNGEEEIAI
jgi:hypothetical protein